MTVPATETTTDAENPVITTEASEQESAPLPPVSTVESPLAQAPNNSSLENDNAEEDEEDEEEEDDDDMTIIGLDQDPEQGNNDQQAAALAWIEQNGPEMEERRRNVLLRELQRVQRASFIHFVLLCLIPTSLLFIVVATVLGEDESCVSDATFCAKEARTFINAFTTRCICDAIDVSEGR
uniref:Uncharacterized protein n=1 Tax=Cyclophora tenuis TaxID=216820 RepID=A0A7S1GM78_CYCTE|mmetsp:Transcript_20120/g.34366  ORF Transcript_20120/g.34366 Transcript_20120/m.34366 type:complete len:181 (+) Transcript_20120:51-593(+)